MSINNTHLSTFLIYTAAVVLVCSLVLPLWWKYDFLAHVIRQLLDVKSSYSTSPPRIFTMDELKKYDGSQGDPIYLAITGRVYDVTKGKRHYGKEGGYSFFAGRDATRAFVTGNFKEDGLTDDVTGLTPDQYLGILDWVQTYENDYIYLGNLVGRFYDEKGFLTAGGQNFQKEVEMAKRLRDKDTSEKQEFPECNSEWTPESGVIVWCSTKSGGIKRSWEGFPRRFYKPGQTSFRCACVRKDLLKDARVSQYPGCSEKTKSCRLEE